MTESQTITAAVEKASGAIRMVEAQNFAPVLPRGLAPEKFQRWAVHLLSRPELVDVAKTDPGRLSIVKALMDCASLGLEPGREYHLVPFGGLVTGVTDYKGEIRLITNAQRCVVVAQLVHKADTFHMIGANIPPRHAAPDDDWFADRGPVTGGYAYADFGSGLCSMVVTMNEAEFLHHRDKAKTKSVWDEWPEPQRLKTLVRQLRKWVPWSPERMH